VHKEDDGVPDRNKFFGGNSARGKPKGPPRNPKFGKGSGFHGKKGRSGVYSRVGVDYGMRHGMKAGKLPKGCKYIEIRVNELRRQVEAEVVALKGEINLLDAAAINSIVKWERHGLLAAHWLRHEIGSLSASDRLRFSEAIAKASDARDRNIKLLGLDIKPEPIDLTTYLDGNGTQEGRLQCGFVELPTELPSDESAEEGS
jgi:hypothetical protein